MEIATLKDLKEALQQVPDEVLRKFGMGVNPEGELKNVELLCWGDEPVTEYVKEIEENPIISDIELWMEAIMQVQRRLATNPEDGSLLDRDSPISSEEANKNNK